MECENLLYLLTIKVESENMTEAEELGLNILQGLLCTPIV